MKLSLLVATAGKTEGKLIPITVPQFLIGRDPQCHLRPSSQVISKKHCTLFVRDGKAYVRDLDSTNGTFVNDQQIEGEVELANNTTLKLGPLTFVVRIETTTPVDKPTPVPRAKPPIALDDEAAVAEMLNDIQEEDQAELVEEMPVESGGSDSDSTMIEIPVQAEAEDKTALKPPPKAAEEKPVANTQSAAEAILAKYSRRNRR